MNEREIKLNRTVRQIVPDKYLFCIVIGFVFNSMKYTKYWSLKERTHIVTNIVTETLVQNSADPIQTAPKGAA